MLETRTRLGSESDALHQILTLVAHGAALEDLLDALCRMVERLLPGAQCVLRLAPRKLATNSADAEAEPATERGIDIFGSLAAELRPPICTEHTFLTEPAPSLEGTGAEAWQRHGIQSVWLEPIRPGSGAVMGTVGVYRARPDAPYENEAGIIAMAAGLAAIALERARAEGAARERLTQLAHVARLATMGEMASGLAHELNQPLCAIVNFAEACLELADGDANHLKELRHLLAELARQAERAGLVIRRLRDFVRRREPQRVPVDLNRVVREVVALAQVEARHAEVRVRLKLGKSLPPALADPIQIQQVLVNLVRNAFEAMKRTPSFNRVVTIRTARGRGDVSASVTDCGPGIANEEREHLFEPFFTTKSEGMGMGLSISRSILEVHDGRIWLDSRRREGTTFRFSLPAVRRSRRERHADGVRGG